MFIREVKKQHGPEANTFYQYNLVQASRIDGKVKQRVVLYLGSNPLLRDKQNRKIILNILKARIFNQPQLFPEKASNDLKKLAESFYEKYRAKYGDDPGAGASTPPASENSEFHNTDIQGVEVDDVKNFGPENLCRQVLEKLQLPECLSGLGLSKEAVNRSLIAIAARAIYGSSEYKTSGILAHNSELNNLYGVEERLSHKQLYHIADKLYQHKTAIDNFLYQRITNMFDLRDRLVIFDISNTYFETSKPQSQLARYGRSKEKRNDCPLVVFTGVINQEGFIRHSRIYEGNKADLTTLPDMIADMEENSNKHSQKTIVMDAGIATDDNLSLVKEKGYDYVCVAREQLENYTVSDADKTKVLTDRDKNEVELSILQPEDKADTWMYVRSQAKAHKEHSMNDKIGQRFEEELANIRAGLFKKGGTKKIDKVWQRIGRAKQKHSRVSGLYKITDTQENGKVTELKWEKINKPAKADKEKGIYFIRTSYQDPGEAQLWDIYNTIREVESTFRCLKSDLNIRPVFHQNDERVESHIYLTILAYQLVNTIRYMLSREGLNYDWPNIVRLLSTQTIQTLEIPTEEKTIHIRKPAKPNEEVKNIYDATSCVASQPPLRKFVVYH